MADPQLMHKAPPLLRLGLATDQGRVRDDNQDSLFAVTAVLPPQSVGGKSVPFGFFAVADGMGGLSDGASASNMAVRLVGLKIVGQLLTRALEPAGGDSEQLTLAEMLHDAMCEASDTLFEQAKITKRRSGSTMSAALVIGKQLTLAHVGDSRIYLGNDSSLALLTSDHSIAARLVTLGELDAEDSADNPSRNSLYRSLGLTARLDPEIVTKHLVGYSHLLLCSDGLWSLVSDEEMGAVLREMGDPQLAADRLIEIANARGGGDNISVIVAMLPVAR